MTAANGLAFIGLIFEVLGGSFSIMYSSLVRREIHFIDGFLDDASYLPDGDLKKLFDGCLNSVPPNGRMNLMQETVRKLSDKLENAQSHPDVSNPFPSRLNLFDIPSPGAIDRSTRRIENMCSKGEGAAGIVTIGLCCFMLSLACFAKEALPLAVWIPLLAVSLYVVILYSKTGVQTAFSGIFLSFAWVDFWVADKNNYRVSRSRRPCRFWIRNAEA